MQGADALQDLWLHGLMLQRLCRVDRGFCLNLKPDSLHPITLNPTSLVQELQAENESRPQKPARTVTPKLTSLNPNL